MKKLICLLLLSFFLVSCAASTANSPSAANTPWTIENINAIKGQSGEVVIQRFGEATQKSIDTNGNDIWYYKRPAEAAGVKNTFYRIGSFGMSGDVYVDILTLLLKDNRVVNFSYQENVVNATLPNLNLLNSAMGNAAPAAVQVPVAQTPVAQLQVAQLPVVQKPVKNSAQPTQLASASPMPKTPVAPKEIISELIFIKAANIRNAANDKGKILYKAKKGEKAIKLGSSGNWHHVKLSAGLTGWVFKDLALEVVE